jgi:glycosyltransferase involved in cell wall biosynthesis
VVSSVTLVPYCPWPADTGAKAEMWKHLEVLRELGGCVILSASTKPVGAGWSPAQLAEVERRGFTVRLREEECRRHPIQWAGIGYAALCKALGLERAFGHANPYHRYAFPAAWWARRAAGADLAVIHYSCWARLPCVAPKVLVLHDLWSGVMRWWNRREVEEIGTAQLVVVISTEEEQALRDRGVERTLWSPPLVQPEVMPDSGRIGIVGSPSRFNREGLRWLEQARACPPGSISVHGGLAAAARATFLRPVGRYADRYDPYRECGIVLMTTREGMGVQIKAVEALACGRAIVARRGAMRGLPPPEGGWIEVSSPQEMIDAAVGLQRDAAARARLAAAAQDYYRRHLEPARIRGALLEAYRRVAREGAARGGRA